MVALSLTALGALTLSFLLGESARTQQHDSARRDWETLKLNVLDSLATSKKCSASVKGAPYGNTGSKKPSRLKLAGSPVILERGQKIGAIALSRVSFEVPKFILAGYDLIGRVSAQLTIETEAIPEIGLRTQTLSFPLSVRIQDEEIIDCDFASDLSVRTCAPGTVLHSVLEDGSITCITPEKSLSALICPAGEYLAGISDGQPLCRSYAYAINRSTVARPYPAPPPPAPAPAPAAPAPPPKDPCAGPTRTQPVTITLPSTAKTASCGFGIGDNLSKKNGYIRARFEQNKEPDSKADLAGLKVCSVRSISTQATDFYYDDHLILHINGAVIMTSRNQPLQIDQFPQALDGLRNYSWAAIQGKEHKNPDLSQGIGHCLCAQEGCCTLPKTETKGALSMHLTPYGNPQAKALGQRITKDGAVRVGLVITGDDNSSDDCRHKSDLTLTVELEVVAK